jgi:GNAT superfamily N-acetyltransferase
LIRAALPEDLPLLPAVERSAAALFRGTRMGWAADGPTLAPAVLEEAAARGQLWVAWRPGAGAAGFLLADVLDGDLFVEELSVAREHQRLGLGRALLAHAVDQARDQGLAGISLTTDRDLPWNAPFYAGSGFQVLDGPLLSPLLRERLAQEAAHGHNPAHRCAMRLAFR